MILQLTLTLPSHGTSARNIPHARVKLTRVLILELGDIVDVLIDNNPWVAFAVRRHIFLAKGLRHSERVVV